jgi:chromosome segregation ATPase
VAGPLTRSRHIVVDASQNKKAMQGQLDEHKAELIKKTSELTALQGQLEQLRNDLEKVRSPTRLDWMKGIRWRD